MARGRRSGRGPDYIWSGTGWFQQAQGSATAIGNTVIAVFNEAQTLVRLRGYASATIDPSAAGDIIVISMGFILADDDAVAAGAASIPSPTNDTDGDWIWHGWFPLHAEFSTGEGSDHNVQMVIDSKAMRRVKPNEQLVMVADGQIFAGTPTADLVAGVRVLSAS